MNFVLLNYILQTFMKSSKCGPPIKRLTRVEQVVWRPVEKDEKKHTNGLTASQVSECRKGEEGGRGVVVKAMQYYAHDIRLE